MQHEKLNSADNGGETGWEEVEKLAEQGPGLQTPESKTREESEPSASDEDRVAAAMEAVKDVYAQARATAANMDPTETSIERDESQLLGIKHRSKFDVIGKLRDKRRLEKITDLLFNAEEDQLDTAMEKIGSLMDEYTVEGVIDLFNHSAPGLSQLEGLCKLFDNIKSDVLKQKMFTESVDPTYAFNFLNGRGYIATERLQDIALEDLIEKMHDEQMGPAVAKKFDDHLVGGLDRISDASRAKLMEALVETDNLRGASQLLTPELAEKYAAELTQMFAEQGDPFNAAFALTRGCPEEIVQAPESLQEMVEVAKREGYRIGSFMQFTDYETIDILGPQISEIMLADTEFRGFEKREYNQESATILRDFHDKLAEQGGDVGAGFIYYFANKPALLSSLQTQELTPELVQNINRAILAHIEVERIEDFANINELVQRQIEQRLTEKDGFEGSDMRHWIGVSIFGVPPSELYGLMAKLSIATDSRSKRERLHGFTDDLNNRSFVRYRFDKLDELVAAGKIGPEQEAQVYLALSLLNCGDRPRKLAKFFEANKNTESAGALYPFLQQLDAAYAQEASVNYAAAMLTPEKAAEQGCKMETTSLTKTTEDGETTTAEIPVYHVEGQDFSLLVHRLGAFGGTNMTDPSVWNTRRGATYISTSLIGSECIEVAGGQEAMHSQENVFYGFGNLSDQAILGMSSADLYTTDTGSATSDALSVDTSYNGADTERQQHWYLQPQELLQATRNRPYVGNEDGVYYNEVVLDRFSGNEDDPENRLQPSCLVVFGKTAADISEATKVHADYFGVPIFLVDDTKYKTAKKRLI